MLLHICANLWVKILKFGGVKKIRQLFDISKIQKNWHFWCRKWPISDLFKNPNQGVESTLLPTYRLILDQISQCRVPSKLSQMCGKMDILRSMPHWTPLVCCTPPKNGTTILPRYLPTYKAQDTLMPY